MLANVCSRLSDRLASNFTVKQMSFYFGTAVTVRWTRHYSSTVKLALSACNTVTLLSVVESGSRRDVRTSSSCQQGDMDEPSQAKPEPEPEATGDRRRDNFPRHG